MYHHIYKKLKRRSLLKQYRSIKTHLASQTSVICLEIFYVQNPVFFFFLLFQRAQNFVQFGPNDFVYISPAYGTKIN